MIESGKAYVKRLFCRPTHDKTSLNINFNNWINRYAYTDIDRWRRKARVISNEISSPGIRAYFLKKEDPKNQHRILELLAKFNNQDPKKINSYYDEQAHELVGDIFGDILIHYASSSDQKRSNRFFTNSILLDISRRSTIIGLEKLFRLVNSDSVSLPENMKIYLISILLDLRIDFEQEGSKQFADSMPHEVFAALTVILKQRKEQIRSQNSVTTMLFAKK